MTSQKLYARSVSLRRALPAAFFLFEFALSRQSLTAQTDPGFRASAPLAGAPVAGLSPEQLAMFNQAKTAFQEVDGVAEGLGPRFNADSCATPHLSSLGGQQPTQQPPDPIRQFAQRAAAFRPLQRAGGGGAVPSGCNLVQENFSNSNNISLRIPTPTFGLGLIEAIPDAVLVRNLANNSGQKSALGIGGKLNRNGNDGTVTRFGWKAQNKSLTIFAGEAYNVEQGITNLLFPNERDDTSGCSPSASPSDSVHMSDISTLDLLDDATQFAAFMRFLAPPARGPIDNTVVQGGNQFVNIGCALCHTATLVTGTSGFGPALTNQTIHPFSDFAVHAMGSGLADRVSQGLAAGDEFRTAPLWGLGQRIFLLHDGRTIDLMQAIQAHASPGSEANAVIRNFNALSRTDQAAVLAFLRSL